MLQEAKEITPDKLTQWFLMLLLARVNGYVVKQFPTSAEAGLT